jgi:preprotein translocase subunit SecA
MMIMNAQREVYKRRRHALFGERLKLDIANMLYDTCELFKTKKS